MSFLSKEALDALKRDPALAAVAEKLESEQFIPKSRFDEVNLKAKEAADALVKAESERAQRQQELEQQAEDERRKRKTLEQQLATEKAEADRFREYRKTKLNAFKDQFGDEWLPEYETFSLESLEKLSERWKAPAVRVDPSKPGLKVQPRSLMEMTPEEREQFIAKAKSGTL